MTLDAARRTNLVARSVRLAAGSGSALPGPTRARIRGSIATRTIAASASSPSAAETATGPSLGSSPAPRAQPRMAAQMKLGLLVRTKKETLRRAIRSVLIPPCRSAQAPSARPPTPPAGTSTLVPCSAIPIS